MVELSPAQHAGLIRAFSEMKTVIDVLLVDTAAGISDMVLSLPAPRRTSWWWSAMNRRRLLMPTR